MAMRFFRRNQKLVIIIMAVLMVSFLIGFQGFQSFVRGSRGSDVYGKLGDDTKIKTTDYSSASQDVQILDELGFHGLSGYGALARMNPQQGDMILAFALLLKEAERASVTYNESTAEQFLQEVMENMGLTGAKFEQFRAQICRKHDIAAKDLYRSVGHWQMIQTYYASSQVATPPSMPELRHLYRNLRESINLLLVDLPAEGLVAEVGEPTPQDIIAMFQQYRAVKPEARFPNLSSLGFSYYQPDKAAVAYLLVRRDVLDRAVTAIPGSDELLRYYNEHAAEFVREEPATQPATAATQQAEPRKIQLSYSQAKDEILAMFHSQAVEERENSLLDLARKAVAEYNADPKAAAQLAGREFQDPYDYARFRLSGDAGSILQKKVTLELTKERLDSAIRRLQEAAGLEQICYPWGRHGEVNLDPAVQVTLSVKDRTLDDVLAEITKQVKLPALQWATCATLPGVIFPVSGVDFFPVSVRKTGLMDAQAMQKDDVLGRAQTDTRGGRGQPMVQVIFSAADFRQNDKERGSALQKGWEGQPMVVFGSRGQQEGKLLWRLADTSPAQVPDRVTDEIRKQVIADWKIQQALRKASEKAGKLAEAAKADGLAAAAKADKLEAKETGDFTREAITSPRQFMMQLALMRGLSEAQADAYARTAPPIELSVSRIPLLPPLPQEAQALNLQARLMDELFKLVPEKVEPPYPPKPYAVEALTIPALQRAIVIQRVGYQPAVEGEFQATRSGLADAIKTMRSWRAMLPWYHLANIEQRLGYKGQDLKTQPLAPQPDNIPLDGDF